MFFPSHFFHSSTYLGILFRALLNVSALEDGDDDRDASAFADVSLSNVSNAEFLFAADSGDRLAPPRTADRGWRYLREPVLRRRYSGVLR